MANTRRVIQKVFKTLFAVMMSCVVFAIFVPPKSINWVKAFGSYNALVKILIAMLAIVLVAFRVWLYGKTKNIKIKISPRKLWIIGGIVTLLACLFAMYVLMPEPYNTFDSAQVYDYVRRASNGAPMENEFYFNRYPHNLGIVLFYLSFVRLGALVGLSNPQILMPIVTAIAVAITIVITAYLAEKFCKRTSGVRVWIIMLVTPILLYAAEMYTDSISGLFIALELFVALKISECKNGKEKALLAVIFSVISGIGAFIKVTSLIPVIAISISMLIKKRRAGINRKYLLRTCGVGAICVLCFAGVYGGYKKIEGEILPGAQNGALPYSHWVMMGMGGDGIFSSEDLEASLSHAPNTTEFNIETIKERLGDMGAFGYIELLARKISVTWGDGTYEISRVVGTQPRKPESLAVQIIGVNGRYFKYYRLATTILQVSWLIAIAAMSILSIKRNNSKMLALEISLLGIFIFLLIWETNSRYLVNFLPVLIILQEYSISLLWKRFAYKKKIAKNK